MPPPETPQGESAVRGRITESLSKERLGLELRRARRPFVWWALVIAGALIAFTLLLKELHLPAPWQTQYTVRIAAPDLTGVQSNDEVRIAGVEVGHVAGVSLVRGIPVVTATISPQYGRLYRDAQVQIRPNTPLEDMFVDIVTRGSRAAGAIPSGGELAASQVQSPVQIGQVIDIFDSAVRPRVSAAIDALGDGLGDHGAQLRAALVELAPFLRTARAFTQAFAVRQADTARLIHNFALLNAALADRSDELTALVRDGAITFDSLANAQAPLGQLIDELPPTLAELPRSFAAVDSAAAQIDPALSALEPVAGALFPALHALQRLSPLATRALAALEQPLPSLTALARHTGPVAGSLGQAFTRLLPQAPELDRATAAIIPCETPLSDFFQYTLSVSKLYGPHGDMQRGIGLLSPESFTGFAAPSADSDTVVAKVAPTCAVTNAGTL